MPCDRIKGSFHKGYILDMFKFEHTTSKWLMEKKSFEIIFKSGSVTKGKYGLVLLREKRIDDMYSIVTIINKFS